MTRVEHILFPYDFSSACSRIAPHVRTVAERFGAKVTLLSVVPPAWDLPPSGMGPLIGDTPAEWVASLRARLDPALETEFAAVPVDRIAEAGDPAIRIAAFAGAHGVDLIMMPTHGLGAFRTLLVGSVTAKVLHDAACPVWTAAHTETPQASALPRTVLCAIDGTPATQPLVEWAAGFTAGAGGTLKLIHVVPAVTDWPSLAREQALQEQFRQETRERLESIIRRAGVEAPLSVRVGEIVPTVSEEIRHEQADLLIIGRGAVQAAFGRLRTHAFGLIQRSPSPVISV